MPMYEGSKELIALHNVTYQKYGLNVYFDNFSKGTV